MQFIPAMKLSGSILSGRGEPNVSDVQDSAHWPGGFNAILARELDADKTSNSNEEEGDIQDAILGFAPAIYEGTLSDSDIDSGFLLDYILSEVTGVGTAFSEKITPPKSSPVTVSSSPDVVLIDEQVVVGQGVQGKAIDINNQSFLEQKIPVSKGIVEKSSKPILNITSGHIDSKINPEKLSTVPEEGAGSLKQNNTAEIQVKPTVLPGDMEGQIVEETVGNIKDLSIKEGNEIKTCLTKESFEKYLS